MGNKNNQLQQSNNNRILLQQKEEMFSGPVPHPEIIERYEKIYPGAAKQIFEEYDRQVLHRHSIERSVVRTDNIKSVLGHVLGFVVVMSTIGTGVCSLMNGFTLFGGGFSFSGLAMLVYAFKTSRKIEGK